MTFEEALQMAAQCWCREDTENIEMDARLADAFALRLVHVYRAATDAACEKVERLPAVGTPLTILRSEAIAAIRGKVTCKECGK